MTSSANSVLHPWLKEELTAILAGLPEPEMALSSEENRRLWKSWQEGLSEPITLSAELPPLRVLLVLDMMDRHPLNRAQDAGDGAVDVRARGDAAVHAAGWELAHDGSPSTMRSPCNASWPDEHWRDNIPQPQSRSSSGWRLWHAAGIGSLRRSSGGASVKPGERGHERDATHSEEVELAPGSLSTHTTPQPIKGYAHDNRPTSFWCEMG